MARKPRPAFSATRPAGASTGWVYRSSDETSAVLAAPSEPLAAAAEGPVDAQRLQRARAIVRNYAALAAATGFVPAPLLDTALLSGVQLRMIGALAAHYGIPFEKESGGAVFASLCGGMVSAKSVRRVGRSLLKAVPGVGTLLGTVTMPLLGGSSTYAVGLVFVRHFEKGGTLDDFSGTTPIAALAR
jgi:uncharacterized protein (DUF697 family)